MASTHYCPVKHVQVPPDSGKKSTLFLSAVEGR